MKTTVDIADSLLEDARQVAAREGTTVKVLVEEGLRRALADRKKKEPFHLRRVTFKGQGLQPPLTEGAWDAIRDRAYEGRGA